jgi:hypothetical protein
MASQLPHWFIPFLFVAYPALIIVNGIWAFIDARKRGKSGILVSLLVVVIPFPFGPLAWLIFRPALKLG